MNRKAYEERLRAIKLSEFDSQVYEGYASQVRKQIQSLKNIINSLQAKANDRQWLKNQTEGTSNDSSRPFNSINRTKLLVLSLPIFISLDLGIRIA
jgi:hypothetical protein